MTDNNDEGKEAFLVSLTSDQIEQLQNDDIAVVETEDFKFVMVPREHESEALDAVSEGDAEVVSREVTDRD